MSGSVMPRRDEVSAWGSTLRRKSNARCLIAIRVADLRRVSSTHRPPEGGLRRVSQIAAASGPGGWTPTERPSMKSSIERAASAVIGYREIRDPLDDRFHESGRV